MQLNISNIISNELEFLEFDLIKALCIAINDRFPYIGSLKN